MVRSAGSLLRAVHHLQPALRPRSDKLDLSATTLSQPGPSCPDRNGACTLLKRLMEEVDARFFVGLFVLGILALSVATASAQDRRRRQPHTGSEAVGFEVGAFVPNDDQFNSDLLVNGLFEYYVRPRVSLRTEFGLTDPGHTREPVHLLRQVPLRLDVNYNWEGGVWHPFVGAGIGAYFLRNKDNGVPFGNTFTEPGINGRRP